MRRTRLQAEASRTRADLCRTPGQWLLDLIVQNFTTHLVSSSSNPCRSDCDRRQDKKVQSLILCFKGYQHTIFYEDANIPYFMVMPTYRTSWGCQHTVLHWDAHIPYFMGMPTYRTSWGCPHTVLYWDANIPYFIKMPTYRTLLRCPHTVLY